MASTAFPALAINTQGESPINLLGKIEQIKSAQQSQEMGSIQLQQARLQQQSNAAIMSAIANHQGNLDEALAEARASGKVLPNDLLNLQEKSVALQTAMYKNSEANLANITKQNEMITNTIDSVKALPVEQRGAAIINAVGELGKQGVDVSKGIPAVQALVNNPTDEAFKQFEIAHMGVIWAANKATAEYQQATRPSVEQAQQTHQLELQKLQSEALSAQRLFENLPTPIQANTEREAKLRQENSQTAKNYADIAKTKFDMFIKQNEPVEGTNAAGLREVTTRVDANAKKMTQLTDLTSDQYNKESMLSVRFGQVANNLGKYEAAIKQGGPIVHKDDLAQVISDQALGNAPGFLHLIPSGNLVASKEVAKVTADAWNRLTPDERQMARTYLQVKGGIITYNKAVDDTGRANETALSLEAANIPTPLEEKTVALSRIQGNKDNLKTILPAIPHFSHLEDPMKYLQAGENTPISSPNRSPEELLPPEIGGLSGARARSLQQ